MGAIDASVFGFIGNLFVRKVYFPESGDYMEGHRHQFDHVTFVSQGAIRFRKGDEIRDVVAPDFIEAPAQVVHDMIALKPNSCAWCVFAMRDSTGQVLDAADRVRATGPQEFAG